MNFIYLAAALITLVAAVTDAKGGRIPNWLTFPVIAMSPVFHGVSAGASGLWLCVGGLVICGAVPLLIYIGSRGAGIGGGDVKLFAALGCVAGPGFGLEVQWVAYCLAGAGAMLWLTWRGCLWSTLASALRVRFFGVFSGSSYQLAPSTTGLTPVVEPSHRARCECDVGADGASDMAHELRRSLRLGPCIAVAAVCLMVLRTPWLWIWLGR